jgi:hypothetical protein
MLGCESGGTPLWDTSSVAIDQLTMNGKKNNKALVIFTDGQDSTPVDTVIAKAKAAGVRVFTVAFSTGAEITGPSIVAQETGGALFFAEDAGSMISAFRGMNLLLTGDYDRNTCKQTFNLSSTAGSPPPSLQTKAHIKLGGKEAVAAVRVRVGSGCSGTPYYTCADCTSGYCTCASMTGCTELSATQCTGTPTACASLTATTCSNTPGCTLTL